MHGSDVPRGMTYGEFFVRNTLLEQKYDSEPQTQTAVHAPRYHQISIQDQWLHAFAEEARPHMLPPIMPSPRSPTIYDIRLLADFKADTVVMAPKDDVEKEKKKKDMADEKKDD